MKSCKRCGNFVDATFCEECGSTELTEVSDPADNNFEGDGCNVHGDCSICEHNREVIDRLQLRVAFLTGERLDYLRDWYSKKTHQVSNLPDLEVACSRPDEAREMRRPTKQAITPQGVGLKAKTPQRAEIEHIWQHIHDLEQGGNQPKVKEDEGPRLCVECEAELFLVKDEHILCKECLGDLRKKRREQRRCLECGANLPNTNASICDRCRGCTAAEAFAQAEDAQLLKKIVDRIQRYEVETITTDNVFNYIERYIKANHEYISLIMPYTHDGEKIKDGLKRLIEQAEVQKGNENGSGTYQLGYAMCPECEGPMHFISVSARGRHIMECNFCNRMDAFCPKCACVIRRRPSDGTLMCGCGGTETRKRAEAEIKLGLGRSSICPHCKGPLVLAVDVYMQRVVPQVCKDCGRVYDSCLECGYICERRAEEGKIIYICRCDSNVVVDGSYRS